MTINQVSLITGLDKRSLEFLMRAKAFPLSQCEAGVHAWKREDIVSYEKKKWESVAAAIK